MEKKSLKGRAHKLSDSSMQLEVLTAHQLHGDNFPAFSDKISQFGFQGLKAQSVNVLQINLGKMCNQTCAHCHVDAGPDRKEIMTRNTMQACLDAVKKGGVSVADLTGGAPEMNPDFRWFVEGLSALGVHIIVRCNLTIILANPKYHSLPEFFKAHNVEVVSSLPHFSARRTDNQRGEGVFEKSVKALKMLNAVGYGLEDNSLQLNLVYNPSGAFLPSDQIALEREFKHKLKGNFGISFNNLFAITNLPISRFLDYLVSSGNYEAYMEKLLEAFNPEAIAGVMCRDTISVGWDGYLYDCDFNQMLDMNLERGMPQHIKDFDSNLLKRRNIRLGQHCYGCTAGSGSSCGGTTT